MVQFAFSSRKNLKEKHQKQIVYLLRKYDFFSWKEIPFPSSSHNIMVAVLLLQKFPLPPKVPKENSLIF